MKIVGEQTEKKALFNGTVTKNILSYLTLLTLKIYIDDFNNLIKNKSEYITEIYDNRDDLRVDSRDDLRDDIIMGQREIIEKDAAALLSEFIMILQKDKKMMNITNYEINQDVLKSKEKEKSKITKRLGDLTVDER